MGRVERLAAYRGRAHQLVGPGANRGRYSLAARAFKLLVAVHQRIPGRG